MQYKKVQVYCLKNQNNLCSSQHDKLCKNQVGHMKPFFIPASVYPTHITRSQRAVEDILTGSVNGPMSQHGSTGLAGKQRIQLDSYHSVKRFNWPSLAEWEN